MAERAPVVLVTGAARRIGAAIVRHFHSRGFLVIIHYNSSMADADRLCETLNRSRPDSALLVQGNLANPADTEKVVRFVQDIGRLDALVNNASAFYPTPLQTAHPAQWQELMGSNLHGPFLLCSGLSALLSASRGAIVTIADIHALRGKRNFSIYCMAKAGAIGMTKCLARDLAPAVRVNAVAPGAILWPQGASAAAYEQQRLNHIPLQRLGTPEEIAATVYFLAREASYITGQTIAVDGGVSHCL